MTELEKKKEFMELYNKYKDNIWRYCLFMCKNRDKAKDLLGDSILEIYSNYYKLKNKDAFLSYFFTIASRKYYKSISKIQYEIVEFDELFINDLKPDERTDITILYEALNKLPDYYKDSIILFEIEGFSRKEIAIIQSVSEDTVKSRLSRGRKMLSDLLGVNNNE